MKIDAKELKGKARERGRKKRQRQSQKRVPARSSALRFGILMSCTQSGKLKQRLQRQRERERSKREKERQENRLIETGE